MKTARAVTWGETVVVLPSVRQTEDPMLRISGIGIAAVVLAALGLAVFLGRSEHRTAKTAGSAEGTN